MRNDQLGEKNSTIAQDIEKVRELVNKREIQVKFFIKP